MKKKDFTSSQSDFREPGLRSEILLSVQRALLGEVSPALRGITVGYHDQEIQLRCYFDGPITDEDREAMSCVAAEVIADFPEPWIIEEQVIREDAPGLMESLQAWAYRRYE